MFPSEPVLLIPFLSFSCTQTKGGNQSQRRQEQSEETLETKARRPLGWIIKSRITNKDTRSHKHTHSSNTHTVCLKTYTNVFSPSINVCVYMQVFTGLHIVDAISLLHAQIHSKAAFQHITCTHTHSSLHFLCVQIKNWTSHALQPKTTGKCICLIHTNKNKKSLGKHHTWTS